MRELQADAPGQVSALAYSPDGSLLAVGSSNGQVRLWCPATGRLVRPCQYASAEAHITSLAFHPNGQSLAVGMRVWDDATNQQWRIGVWDTASGMLERALSMEGEGPTAPSTLVLYRPDGQRLVAAQLGRVTEWDTESDQVSRFFSHPYSYQIKSITSLAYGPEKTLAIGELNLVHLWPPTGNDTRGGTNWPEGEIVGLQFLPGQPRLHQSLVLVARGRDVGLFRVNMGDHWKREKLLRHSDPVRAIALSPDGRRLLTAGDDWTVHLWDAGLWQKVGEHNFRRGPVRLLAIAPDGMTAAVVGAHRPGVLLWDLE